MTEVLHTADTHVGYRQYNSPDRRADFLDAFERVLEAAVERGVDAVVHAGDLFHDRRPGLSDLLGTVDALRVLDDAGVPFLAVVGNHEDKREAQWLDLFETLGLATRLDDEGTVVGDVTFYGLDYVPRSRRDRLDYQFAEPSTDRTALVAHGQFAPLAPSVHGDAWDVEAVLDAANVPFDAVLLGDEHEADQAQVGGAWVTYSGSTERTSASERDDRGYNLVSFDDGVDVRRRGLETRPFAFVDVDLAEGEGVERVREAVRAHDLQEAVCVVTVEGEGESFPPATVEEYAREAGALVARVNDRREIADEEDEDLDVNFADPDDAVRERVRELGLSGAARDVEETVRESGLADANVREEVTRRVENLLESDASAFEPAPPDSERSDGSGEEDGDADGEATASERVDDADGVDDDTQDAADAESASGADAATEGRPADDGADGDQQASMEEYL